MKLLYLNMKKGEVKMLTQNLDDLWYLSNIIDPYDIVEGKTFRKIKSQFDDQKSRESTKKSVFLRINAEKIEFSKYTNVLRVSGIIIGAPEDIPLGEYHTFNIDDNTAISITKERWLKYQLDRLKEACSEQKSSVLICILDREEAFFALLKKYGYEILTHIKGDVKKKVDENIKKENFYHTIINKLSEYVERHKIKQVVLASPAFWKEDLFKEIKDEKIKSMTILATCSSVMKNAIEEVIKRPEMKESLSRERSAKEINKVEELFTEISKDNLAVYGLNETKKACDLGAVKDLLVTDSLIMKSRNENFYITVENIMKSVDNTKGEINIISSDHEGGKKLDGLGGIGAILRFKLNY